MTRLHPIARRLLRLEKDVRDVANYPQLGASSIDDEVVESYDDNGDLRLLVGRQSDGTFGAITVGPAAPPVPSPAILGAEVGGLTVTWDGTFAGGAAAPADFYRIDIFTGSSSSVATDGQPVASINAQEGGTVFLPYASVAVYVVLCTRTLSLQLSAGSVVQTTTPLAPAGDSDGIAPTVAPTGLTVASMPAGMLASHDGISNPDPVEYRYYITDNNADTPGPALLVSQGTARSLFIGTLADKITPLSYTYVDGSGVTQAKPYYVAVGAVDGDGAGPVSAWVQGFARQIGPDDIDASSVYALQIFADSIIGGSINTPLALVGRLELGGGSYLDTSGLHLIGSDGVTATIDLPTDPARIASILADFQANSIEAVGPVTLHDPGNVVLPGGKIILGGQTQNPVSPPNVTQTRDWSIPVTHRPSTHKGLYWDSSAATFLSTYNVDTIVGGDASKDSTVTHVTTTSETDLFTITDYNAMGAVRLGSSIWTLGKIVHGALDGHWFFKQFNATAPYAQTATYEWGAYSPSSQPPNWPALGTMGSNLLVACRTSTNVMKVTQYTTAGVASTAYTTSYPIADKSAGVVFVPAGSGGMTSDRIVAQSVNTNGDDWPFIINPASPATDLKATESFLPAGGGVQVGLAWDGTNMWSLSNLGWLTKYGNDTWTTGSSTRWGSYSWYDSNATGGNHETMMSPRKSYPALKRHETIISVPQLPVGTGSTDDVTGIRTYLSVGAADSNNLGVGGGSNSGAYRQATGADGALSARTAVASFSGTGPPASNNFPASTAPAEINDGALGYWKATGPAYFPYAIGVGNKMALRAYRGPANDLSIPDSVYTLVPFVTVDAGQDPLGMNNSGAGTITIPTGYAGYWRITCAYEFDGSATGRRLMRFNKNSTTVTTGSLAFISAASNGVSNQSLTMPAKDVLLAQGDVLRWWAWQNSGGALLLSTTHNCPYVQMQYLGTA